LADFLSLFFYPTRVVKAMFTKGLMDDMKFRETSDAFKEELQGQPAKECEELFSAALLRRKSRRV
jgi:hypothetical protein